MMSFELDDAVVDKLAKQHRWAATGVSDYPPRDPLVGQSRFLNAFKPFYTRLTMTTTALPMYLR